MSSRSSAAILSGRQNCTEQLCRWQFAFNPNPHSFMVPHTRSLEKINQELDRAEALLQEAGPTYTEKKAVATDKDFRRRLRKIENKVDREQGCQPSGDTQTSPSWALTPLLLHLLLPLKLSDERESASAAVRDAMSSPKIITALLSVALAVCTEAADSEAAGVGAWRDRLCASLADIHTQATALWADFHRQRSQGFNAVCPCC